MRKSIRRGGATLAGIAVVVGGGLARDNALESMRSHGADRQYEQDVRDARVAIAQRYAGCSIVALEGNSSTINVVVDATVTSRALAAESKYARADGTGDVLVYNHARDLNAASLERQADGTVTRGDSLLAKADVSHKGNGRTERFAGTLTLRPDAGDTPVEVSLAATASTHDQGEHLDDYTAARSIGQVSCGIVTSDPKTGWHVSNDMETLPPAYQEQACHSALVGPQTYKLECN